MVETFAYDGTYGTITEHHKTEETYNPYCYTGREFDSKELYYYRARYYDPTIGRFISQDPIEFLAGDFNFYRYVGNDPVNFIDPGGLKKDGCSKLAKRLERLEKKGIKNLRNKAAKVGFKNILKGTLAFVTVEIPLVDILTAGLAADGVLDAKKLAEELNDMLHEASQLSKKLKKCRDTEKSKLRTKKGAKVTAKKMEDTAMKQICDRTKPPSSMSGCAKASFELAVATGCLAARKKIQKKWYNNKTDAGHKQAITEVQNRIELAAKRVRNLCGK